MDDQPDTGVSGADLQYISAWYPRPWTWFRVLSISPGTIGDLQPANGGERISWYLEGFDSATVSDLEGLGPDDLFGWIWDRTSEHPERPDPPPDSGTPMDDCPWVWCGEFGWARDLGTITDETLNLRNDMVICSECHANIGPLDGGHGGRHDSTCMLYTGPHEEVAETVATPQWFCVAMDCNPDAEDPAERTPATGDVFIAGSWKPFCAEHRQTHRGTGFTTRAWDGTCPHCGQPCTIGDECHFCFATDTYIPPAELATIDDTQARLDQAIAAQRIAETGILRISSQFDKLYERYAHEVQDHAMERTRRLEAESKLHLRDLQDQVDAAHRQSRLNDWPMCSSEGCCPTDIRPGDTHGAAGTQTCDTTPWWRNPIKRGRAILDIGSVS